MEQMMNRIPFTCLPLHNHIQYTPLISACHLKHKQEHQRFQPIWLQLFACSVHLLYLLFHVYEYMDQENRQKPQSPKSNYIRCIKSKKYLKKRICAHIQPFQQLFHYTFISFSPFFQVFIILHHPCEEIPTINTTRTYQLYQNTPQTCETSRGWSQ